MKKLNEIMQELGFDKEGNQDVQKAFIKNLIKQAQQADKIKKLSVNPGPNTRKTKSVSVKKAAYMAHFRKSPEEQLTFDLQSCGSLDTSKNQAG